METKIVGWVRWVEHKSDMVPYTTGDRRLVVYGTAAAADLDRGYMEVVDPITSADQKDIVARFELAGVSPIGVRRAPGFINEGKAKGETNKAKPETQKRRNAPQKQRKAAQSDARPAQLRLF